MEWLANIMFLLIGALLISEGGLLLSTPRKPARDHQAGGFTVYYDS